MTEQAELQLGCQLELPTITPTAGGTDAFALRDYQEETLTKFKGWYTSDVAEALVALATGMGKTRTACACCHTVVSGGLGRILWVTHRTELLNQSAATLAAYIGKSVGVEQANRKVTDRDCQILIASVQTLKGARLATLAEWYEPALIVFDEAHHSVARTWTQIKLAFPQAKVLNLTATPFRSDISRRLELGQVLAEYNTSDGIKMGVLVPPKLIGTIKLQLDKVAVKMGDYDAESLSELLTKPDVIQACISTVLPHIAKRKGIIFAATVAHGRLIAESLRNAGVWVGEVYGETPQEERAAIYDYVRKNKNSAIVNNLVCTEGLDIPELDLVVIFRPTKNAALYLQMLGRGLRSFLGKDSCLVIDAIDSAKQISGNTSLVLPTDDDVRKASAMGGTVLNKVSVFFSWFYRQADIKNYIEDNKQIPQAALTGLSAEYILSILMPAFIGKWTPSQRLNMQELGGLFSAKRDQKDVFSLLSKYTGTRHIESLVSLLCSAGLQYCANGQLPHTYQENEELSDKLDVADADAEGGFSLEVLAKLEPNLQNFILNIVGETDLKKQAASYYEVHNIDGAAITWYKVLNYSCDFTFIDTYNKETQLKTYWLRYLNGIIVRYDVTRMARGASKYTRYPYRASDNIANDIPTFSKGTSWSKQEATPGQLEHVQKILSLTSTEIAKMNISRLSAAALMSNAFAKRDLAYMVKLPKPKPTATAESEAIF